METDNNLPVAVVCYYAKGIESALKEYWMNVGNYHPMAGVPFFVFTDGEVLEDPHSFRATFKFVDDIITADAWNHLEAKIATINKFKKICTFPTYQQREVAAPRYTRHFVSNFLKRSLDLTVAPLILLALSPLMLLIALLIRLESKGPIFYAATRAGRNYKIFKFYKFRTMVANADKKLKELQHLNMYEDKKDGPVFFKVSNDPRITKLGKFLRNTSLDELPQLLNVIKGDMSLVGNRPLPLYEATSLTTDSYAERFLAPAGITGLWQVKKRGNKEMSVEERIELDISYAHQRSFRYDMWLIINTPKALVQKDNV
ncbi:sugar transferase [Chitinophaga silvatica]|uniref:Sugar transferase n=2 Tax=Chitinophaga silvatica TaxID=2282649 RepID=A0A3E1Y4R2_9BACT|nr:sugar transferase [Chitinophaga silvatica]